MRAGFRPTSPCAQPPWQRELGLPGSTTLGTKLGNCVPRGQSHKPQHASSWGDKQHGSPPSAQKAPWGSCSWGGARTSSRGGCGLCQIVVQTAVLPGLARRTCLQTHTHVAPSLTPPLCSPAFSPLRCSREAQGLDLSFSVLLHGPSRAGPGRWRRPQPPATLRPAASPGVLPQLSCRLLGAQLPPACNLCPLGPPQALRDTGGAVDSEQEALVSGAFSWAC